MYKVPWWYWPVTLVPGVICAALIPFVLRAGTLDTSADGDVGAPEVIGVAFSLYASLVLLGYLLLALCGHRREVSSAELTPASVANPHDV